MRKPKRPPLPPPPLLLKPEDFPSFFMERTSFLFHRTAITMMLEFGKALAPLRIRPHHFVVMAVLSTGQPPSQIEVGAKVRYDRNKMVNIVDELEQLGLAKREVNPNDRRAKAVRLTDMGQATYEAALKIETAVEEKCLSALTAPQRKQLHEMLKIVVAAQKK